ncbi:uncharacterized protein LOC144127541 [Amblyomma americanum]
MGTNHHRHSLVLLLSCVAYCSGTFFNLFSHGGGGGGGGGPPQGAPPPMMPGGMFDVTSVIDIVETIGTADIDGNVLVEGGEEGSVVNLEPGTPPQVTKVQPPPPPAAAPPPIPPPPPVEEPPPPPSYGSPRRPPSRPTGGYGGGPAASFDDDVEPAGEAPDFGDDFDSPGDIYGRAPAVIRTDDAEYEEATPAPRAVGYARLVSAGGRGGRGRYRQQTRSRPAAGAARYTSGRGAKKPRLVIKRFPIEKLSAALQAEDPLALIGNLEARSQLPRTKQQRSQRLRAGYTNRDTSKKSKWKTVGVFPASSPLQSDRGVATSSGKWPANVEHRGRNYRGMKPVVLHLSMKGAQAGGTTKRPKWIRSIMLIPSSVDMKNERATDNRRRHRLYIEE